eukprot:3372929-Amphidinium_carterae.1
MDGSPASGISAAFECTAPSARPEMAPAWCGTSEAVVSNETVADCAVAERAPLGAVPIAASALPMVASNRRALVQSALWQPRGCKVAQIVTEYAYRVWIPCGQVPQLSQKRRSTSVHPALPLGSRLISCSTLGSSDLPCGVDSCCPGCGAPPFTRGAENCKARGFEFGAYRTPLEWHLSALSLLFPMDVVPFLRPWQGLALVNLLSRAPSDVVKSRAETLRRIGSLKRDLHAEEE